MLALLALIPIALRPNGAGSILLVLWAAMVAARYEGRSLWLWIGTVNLIAALVMWAFWPAADYLWITWMAYVSFQAFAALVMRYAAQSERMSERLRQANTALASINAELLGTRSLLDASVRDSERLRISRELHDVAGHKLTALKLNLKALQRNPTFAGSEELGVAADLSDELLQDIRAVVQQLRLHDAPPLRDALLALAAPFPQLSLALQLDESAARMSITEAEAVLRCVQEALTNAARHGNAGPGNANRIAAVNLSIATFIRYASASTCDTARSAVRAAVDNLRSLEIAVVAGAGNDAAVNELPSPACLTGVTSVGATTAAVPVVVAEFSNDASFLDLLAPGVQVTTAVPGGTYTSTDGTSMSTPHVAGAWAVLKQAVPGASVAAVQSALAATGTPLAHSVTSIVHPIINVNAARLQLLGATGSAPGAVTALRVSATGNALAMSWAAPQAGGAPATYTVLARLTPGGPIVATVPAGNATSFSAAAPGGTFVVSVQASNGAGSGPESNPVTVTFPGLPALPFRPTNLAVTVAGSTATFTWSAPTGGGRSRTTSWPRARRRSRIPRRRSCRCRRARPAPSFPACRPGRGTPACTRKMRPGTASRRTK